MKGDEGHFLAAIWDTSYSAESISAPHRRSPPLQKLNLSLFLDGFLKGRVDGTLPDSELPISHGDVIIMFDAGKPGLLTQMSNMLSAGKEKKSTRRLWPTDACLIWDTRKNPSILGSFASVATCNRWNHMSQSLHQGFLPKCPPATASHSLAQAARTRVS